MIEWIERLLENRKNRRRDAGFRRNIAAYRRKVLEPNGLDLTPQAELIHQKKNRRVFADSRRVWKFYHDSQRDFARNFAAAAAVLEEAGVAAPQVLHCDSTKKTARKHGLSLVLMNRVEGAPLREAGPDTPERQRLFGETLAAIHAIASETWGPVARGRRKKDQGSYVDHYFKNLLDNDLEHIGGWLKKSGQPQIEGLREWFSEERLARVSPPDSRHTLISNDAHPGNFFMRPDGTLAIIDLDLAAYWDFPVDLAFVVTGGREGVHPAGADTLAKCIELLEEKREALLEAYFGRLPAHRARWKEVCEPYVLRELLRTTATMIKGMRPDYNDFLGRDPKVVAGFANETLRLVRQWVRKT